MSVVSELSTQIEHLTAEIDKPNKLSQILDLIWLKDHILSIYLYYHPNFSAHMDCKLPQHLFYESFFLTKDSDVNICINNGRIGLTCYSPIVLIKFIETYEPKFNISFKYNNEFSNMLTAINSVASRLVSDQDLIDGGSC